MGFSIRDGLMNLVSGMNVLGKDKFASSEYALTSMSPYQAMAAYRSSSTARKVVDIPADDATREWREWNADADDIGLIEKEEQRLGLQKKLNMAIKAARLLGGAALFIHTGEEDLSKPLNIEAIGRGGIKQVSLISMTQLAAGEITRDITSEYFNQPEIWRYSGAYEGNTDIHASRLTILKGVEFPDPSVAQDQGGWGDSFLMSTLEEIKRHDGTAANVASMVFESKIDIIKIPDLMANLGAPGSAQYEQTLLRRWGLANQAKGINSMLLVDSEEEYEQKQISFATIPDVMRQFMQLVSGAADIPMVRMWGMSPGGLQSSGESDLQNYYDMVKAIQSGLSGDMTNLDKALVQSALGSDPDEIHYNWKSLWQPSLKEKAEIGRLTSETLDRILQMGLIPDQVMQETVINAMTESGVLPGLESAVAQYYDMKPGESLGGVLPTGHNETPDPVERGEPVPAARERNEA